MQRAIPCPNQHALQQRKSHPELGNICDFCREACSTGDWCCDKCGFDLCQWCYQMTEVSETVQCGISAKTPQKPLHPVYKHTSKPENKRCSECGDYVSNEDWQCTACAYEICKNCYEIVENFPYKHQSWKMVDESFATIDTSDVKFQCNQGHEIKKAPAPPKGNRDKNYCNLCFFEVGNHYYYCGYANCYARCLRCYLIRYFKALRRQTKQGGYVDSDDEEEKEYKPGPKEIKKEYEEALKELKAQYGKRPTRIQMKDNSLEDMDLMLTMFDLEGDEKEDPYIIQSWKDKTVPKYGQGVAIDLSIFFYPNYHLNENLDLDTKIEYLKRLRDIEKRCWTSSVRVERTWDWKSDKVVTAYLTIVSDVTANILEIIKKNKDKDKVPIKEMIKEKEFGLYAIKQFANACKSNWKKFQRAGEKLGIFLNFGASFGNEIRLKSKNHPITKIQEINGGAHLSQLDCPKRFAFFGVAEQELQDFKSGKTNGLGWQRALIKILNYAESFKVKFDQLFEELFPGKLRYAPIKSLQRCQEKQKEYDGKIYLIVDFVRAAYIAKSLDEIPGIVDQFKDIEKKSKGRVELKRMKNGFSPSAPQGEYPKLTINLMVDKEMLVELQICFEEVKETGPIDHFYYEMLRTKSSAEFIFTHYKIDYVLGMNDLYERE